MKKILHIFLGLLLMSTVGFAQSAKDVAHYTDSEQYQRARTALKSLIAQNPSAENLYQFGEFYLKLNTARGDSSTDYLDSARIYFARGIAKDPNYAYNHIGIGSVLMAQKNRAEAQKHFATAMSKSGDVEVRRLVGRSYIMHEYKDPAAAIELLEAVVKKEKRKPEVKDPNVFMTLGDAYLAVNEGGKAVTNYEIALNLDKNSPRPHIRIGKLYGRARNYTEALRHFQKAVAADSTYAPAYREIGELYFMAGQYQKAVANYQKYVAKSDAAPETLYKYGAFLFLNKNYAEAIPVLEGLQGKFQNPVVHRLLGYSYAETDSSARALTHLQTFFEKAQPDKLITSDYEYYGKMLAAAGRNDEGIAMLQQAISRDANNYALFDVIGDIYFKNKTYDKAADAYASLISATPKPEAQQYLTLGRSYYFAKNNAMADTTFSKVIELLPDSPTGFLWKARAKVRLDPESTQGFALPYYEKYIDLMEKVATKDNYKKDLIEAYSYLGYYYVLKKDKNRSSEAWNKVLEYDPDNQKAKAGLTLKIR